jgi:processive 1,2-diacylglycerol beta-glucosyltransferase
LKRTDTNEKRTAKRVLIVIGDAGGGHLSAANALTESFQRLYGNQFRVNVIDIFSLVNVRPYKNSAALYIKINKNRLAEFIYNFVGLCVSNRFGYAIYRCYVNAKLYNETRKIIAGYNPDIVVANNSIITPLFQKMKQENARFKTVILVTDIVQIFRGWGDPDADLVISPTREATQRLIHYGVDPKKIHGPLFPINPRLRNFRPRHKVLEELGFQDKNMKTILVTAGGFGVLSLEDDVNDLIRDEQLQLIILAGRIEGFRKELEERYRNNPRIKILGFIDNIEDYYNVADLIIGKPGPATILEIELFQKKAVLTRRVGVQENGNTEFALRNPNFRAVGNHSKKLRKIVSELLAEKEIPFTERRSFDESDQIVHKIAELANKNRCP